MIQKISQDVETIEVYQEREIEKLEEDVSEVKENLNNLVEISRQAMSNSTDGLEKITSMMIDYRDRTIVSDPPMGEKQKKIASEVGQSVVVGKVNSGSCTRTKSRNQDQGTTRFIMEDLEKINRSIIQKNIDFMHSLS